MIESSRISQESMDHHGEPRGEITFSPFLTVLCLVICVSGLVLLLWTVSASEGFRESITISRDLERLSSRVLTVASRLSDLSRVERAMFHLLGDYDETQEQLRLWYAEIPHERRNVLDELYAAILDGEAGLQADLLASIEQWETGSHLEPEIKQILKLAYLKKTSQGNSDVLRFQARLAEEVPANWFYFQLAKRLARQSEDQELQRHLQGQFQQFTDSHLLNWRTLISLELGLVVIGSVCLGFLAVKWFKQRGRKIRETSCEDQSPWTFSEGLAVLVRGGALSIILVGLLAGIPQGAKILQDYGSLLLYLPTVILAMVLLCRQKQQSFIAVLGCVKIMQRLGPSFPILCGGIALGLMGDWLIMLVGDAFDISAHWAEWFLPQLVWGDPAELLKIILDVVILVPIFEEIIFRGLVFSTLRAKYSFPVSMIGSAAIFALAHGYGLIAFLAVFWSGLLWAWMYERTGSVIPGMCAHAINNGLVVGFLIAFFR